MIAEGDGPNLKPQEGRSFTGLGQASKAREGEAEPMKFSSDLVPDPRQAIPEEVWRLMLGFAACVLQRTL